MNDLTINVAAGLISGVLAPILVSRLGGGTPPPTQQVSITGDNNNVKQEIDETTTKIEVIYEQLPAKTGPQTPFTEASNDQWNYAIALGAGAVALVLVYLFIWPVIVWAFVGSAVGLSAVALTTAHATRGTPGPRGIATLVMLLSSGVLLLAAWWTLHGGPGSDISFTGLEARITEQHPNFASGVEGRWTVTTSHPWDILSILGWRGFIYVLTQVGAVALAAAVVWARALEVSGWIALNNLPKNPSNPTLVNRAVRFKELRSSVIAATLLMGVLIALFTGGWAHSWFEMLNERQVNSVTTVR